MTGKGSEVLENLEKATPLGSTLNLRFYDKYGNETKRPNYDAALPEGVTAASILRHISMPLVEEESRKCAFQTRNCFCQHAGDEFGN